MALTAELKVNQRVIGYVECRRRFDTSVRCEPDKPDDVNTYDVELYQGEATRLKTVHHRYGDSALVLLRKALEALT